MQKKYKIIAVCGKAGSGKDYWANKLAKESGYHMIVSSTTRPPREGEIDGINYHYLTEEEFAAARFLESTCFNGWYYGTRYEDLDPDRANIGVFNPAGIKVLTEKEDIELTIVEVCASDKTRLLRQLNREKHPNVKEIIRRYQTDEEDFAVGWAKPCQGLPFFSFDNDKDDMI